jgi:hypothetical protein
MPKNKNVNNNINIPMPSSPLLCPSPPHPVTVHHYCHSFTVSSRLYVHAHNTLFAFNCLFFFNRISSWVPVAHTYNPSYLGGLRSGELCLKASSGKKLVRLRSQPIAGSGGVCLSSQTTKEAETGGLGSRQCSPKHL